MCCGRVSIDQNMMEAVKKTSVEKAIADYGWKCMLKALAMKDKAEEKMMTNRKGRKGLKNGSFGVAWKHVVGRMNNRNEYNSITNDDKGQVEEVGIDNSLINSNSSQVSYYTTGV